jgi:acetolactate synthase small subunit
MSVTAPATSTEVRPHSQAMCFSVFAHAEPSTLPKVCQLIAKRGLIMARLYACVGEDENEMQIDFQLQSISRNVADQIAQSLRQYPDITCVLVSEKG